jgi:hypothetical protein
VIRINGNQLVESAATYTTVASAAARKGTSTTSPIRTLIFNLGQGVSGQGDATDSSSGAAVLGIGYGLLYDINNVAFENYCLVLRTGDVNVSSTITSADIIYLVNYVFKSMAAPLPCAAAGDVNCSANVTSSDIIYLVNYTFKGGALPCDVCYLIPGTWSCP